MQLCRHCPLYALSQVTAALGMEKNIVIETGVHYELDAPCLTAVFLFDI